MTHSRFPSDASSQAAGLSQRASIAVALAPVLVLLALTLVIGDLIGPDIGLAAVAAAIAWLVYEMHSYQRSMAGDEDASPLTGHDVLADS